MNFLKSGNGGYYCMLNDELVNLPYGYEGEIMVAKLETAVEIVKQVQSLAPVMQQAADLVAEYWDVVNANGAYTDEELAPLGITAAQLTACLTLVEQMPKLFEGTKETDNHSSIFPTVYRITVNSVQRLKL